MQRVVAFDSFALLAVLLVASVAYRASYGTWWQAPEHKLQKVMGHGKLTTTLQLYVRKTEDHDAILDVMDDPEE